MLGREGAVDLLSSGPQRPPEPTASRLGRARRLLRHRSTRVAAVVLVAAAALALLQATVRPERRVVDRAASPTTAPPGPTPPFDTRPGRTPIPAPAQTGDLLSGPLPSTGPPSRDAAARATALVLGRYCADPGRYEFTLDPDADGTHDDFHHLNVLVADRQLTDSGPATWLILDWQRTAYRWLGPLTLAGGC
jgi:hypothetical protein